MTMIVPWQGPEPEFSLITGAQTGGSVAPPIPKPSPAAQLAPVNPFQALFGAMLSPHSAPTPVPQPSPAALAAATQSLHFAAARSLLQNFNPNT